MVGVFSSMLNLFLLLTNTFLSLLFFLVGLIPQGRRVRYFELTIYIESVV